MRQVLVLWIHTYSALILTSLMRSQFSFEGEVITLTANHLQWLNRVDTLLALFVNEDIHLLQTYGIVKTLFVDYITEGVLLTCLQTCSRDIPLGVNQADASWCSEEQSGR